MNSDNAIFSSDNRSCGLDGIALSARPVGDALQGAAADCNSAAEKPTFPREISRLSNNRATDNTPGHSANGPGTLKTFVGHPYDNLPCHLTDNPRPTAAAIVALCLIAGVAGALGMALWGLV